MSLPPFSRRHIGPDEAQVLEMLDTVGVPSLDALIDRALPKAIRMDCELTLPEPRTEREALEALAERAGQNRVFRS